MEVYDILYNHSLNILSKISFPLLSFFYLSTLPYCYCAY